MTMIFTVLLILSDLIEFTYDLGVFTRKHILPLVVYLYVKGEEVYDNITSLEYTLKVYHTPLTTGFAYATR